VSATESPIDVSSTESGCASSRTTFDATVMPRATELFVSRPSVTSPAVAGVAKQLAIRSSGVVPAPRQST
jgi:hypothetical protein